jgi:alpha-D-ribose 1-methylphosphonate 5-triphosphate diphosphatase
MPALCLANATLVLPDGLRSGGVTASAGRIVALEAAAGAIDCEGDFLLPGFVDLHTDNLERQVQPRSRARWPSRSAFLAHDAQCAAAGITTVLDSLCVGDLGFEEERRRTCRDGIADLDALLPLGLLKADHYLHLRCELPAPDMAPLLAPLASHARLRLLSLMDHCPGGGQYADLDAYRRMRARDGMAPAAIEAHIEALRAQQARHREPNRRAAAALIAGRNVALASHDDRTEAEVEANAALGVTISEFPTTLAAARAARARGLAIVAGAPNLVRGGSHTGNVAVADLLAHGLVDALASDYVPASLLDAAFLAAATIGLPAAARLVSAVPASLAGLTDRGTLAPGQRADLVRVRVIDGQPVVRAVWRQGERVA